MVSYQDEGDLDRKKARQRGNVLTWEGGLPSLKDGGCGVLLWINSCEG
jgi:hypothetical protein